jgi:nucleotide-binding universal stress UspA family protein
MYRKILLAYDGSLEGAIALREGAILAKQHGAEVCILSVAPDSGGVQMAEGVMGGAVAQHMEHYREVLDRGVSRLTALGMKPTARLAVGEPARVIGAFAKEMGVDLVVVGHQKRSLLERWWSGPTGAYISDYIDCSLLIARNVISDEVFEAQMKAAETEAGASPASPR